MYKVVVFYGYNYNYAEKLFILSRNAEKYFNYTANVMEYKGYPVFMIAMYHNRKKIKEIQCIEVRHV